jgi:HEAT repeat protein
MRRRRSLSFPFAVLGALTLLGGAATADETASVVEDVLARAPVARTEAAQDELAEELVALGIEALPLLIERLSLYQNPEQTVLEKAIVGLGDPAIGPLIEAIAGAYWTTQRGIATTLVRYGDDGVPLLIEALGRSEDAATRGIAARALGSIANAGAADALIRACGRDRQWSVRAFAADALGQIGGVEAAHALRRALGDRDPDVRRVAAQSLGRIASGLSADTLAASAEAERRRAALERSISPLLEALEDERYGVRSSAARALGRIGGRAAASLVPIARGADPHTAGLAMMALGICGGEQARELLVERLETGDWVVRAWAADILGSLPDQEVKALLRAAHGREEHPYVRARLEQALETGEVGEE